MTGITKEELMQMEIGARSQDMQYWLAIVVNQILERAAMGFEDDDEWQESRYTGRAVSRKIRALKINTGD